MYTPRILREPIFHFRSLGPGSGNSAPPTESNYRARVAAGAGATKYAATEPTQLAFHSHHRDIAHLATAEAGSRIAQFTPADADSRAATAAAFRTQHALRSAIERGKHGRAQET